MTKRNAQSQREVMSLIYTQSGPILYGCIRFFGSTKGDSRLTLHRQSSPFVISQSIGNNDVVVYGSLYDLGRELRRLCDDLDSQHKNFRKTLHEAGVATSQASSASGKKVIVSVPDSEVANSLYFEYIREVTNILILLSTQTRNLFDILPRFNKTTISKFDYDGNKSGTMQLREAFDHLVHNRYLFVDGEHIVDIFSDRFTSKSSISKSFMGYKISWREYVSAIRDVTSQVSVTDVTNILRGRLKRLSSKSPHNDIVFLVQNLESFSKILAKKIPDKKYTSMLDLLFSNKGTDYISNLGKGKKVVEETVTFTAPHVKILDELSEKKFNIRVRCKVEMRHDGKYLVQEKDLTEHSIDVGYVELFDRVNACFGQDTLMS